MVRNSSNTLRETERTAIRKNIRQPKGDNALPREMLCILERADYRE